MIILGIDPGLARTGYGVIKVLKNKKMKCLDLGVIETSPELKREERLKKIDDSLGRIIKRYQPNVLATEKVYFFKNLKTVIPVAEASGIVLLNAAKKNIPVFEFTPLEIKFSLTNNGRAEKEEVIKKIKRVFKIRRDFLVDDAFDALACALTVVFKTS
ncbi:MAG: crossover junction endodeoxyribonuclease RuvC [Minisyncoccales bacterium]